jgi:uncharacterized membrane-anchored protein
MTFRAVLIGLLFAAVIAVPALGYFRGAMNPILAFWFAYVVTRPLGASFADWLAVPARRGGLNLGTGEVSLALALLIFCFVAFLAVTRPDVPAAAPAGELGALDAAVETT